MEQVGHLLRVVRVAQVEIKERAERVVQMGQMEQVGHRLRVVQVDYKVQVAQAE